MQATPTLILSAMLLTACATPKVHDTVHHMDHRLSCAMIEHEIREMESHKLQAEESKGLTFRNILTTTLFFPATLATYDNVDEARQASIGRQQHLMSLYAMKGCANEGPAMQTSQPLVMNLQPQMQWPAVNPPQPASSTTQPTAPTSAKLEMTHQTEAVHQIEPVAYRFVDVPGDGSNMQRLQRYRPARQSVTTPPAPFSQAAR